MDINSVTRIGILLYIIHPKNYAKFINYSFFSVVSMFWNKNIYKQHTGGWEGAYSHSLALHPSQSLISTWSHQSISSPCHIPECTLPSLYGHLWLPGCWQSCCCCSYLIPCPPSLWWPLCLGHQCSFSPPISPVLGTPATCRCLNAILKKHKWTMQYHKQ